jgi:hypothetical protein
MEVSNNKTKPPRRRVRTEQEIFALMEKLESGPGIKISAFCKQQHISGATFYNWQKLYRNHKKAKSSPKGFLPVTILRDVPVTSNTAALFAEVKGIRLYQSVSADYLKSLLV